MGGGGLTNQCENSEGREAMPMEQKTDTTNRGGDESIANEKRIRGNETKQKIYHRCQSMPTEIREQIDLGKQSDELSIVQA